uniref:Uncharacterized protein n=1 Tax=Mucochytrium quahogii TaxID=96639 RepID=A0A7S2SPQ1_9STRA|mmetsp:Transcript_12184/g.19806  ORF Transcript_12184/g.19806 Transcript_12184/m.19806 type:complete len:268 (-) Transcript_12184:587-1390(-)|eukprot:CAMPEP_0203760586 /NCGR_PEP_ID=MMETSP0098-20131031/13848_1 /ASSEMBLY_ACC=CAM_ASM_000208 /TAXON_ID=96639 /ORGANISM=" , Strain NY0313808BC1" /LENGTH=267 /DNA_ID=CAMNT_0050654215 /DNA_START=185 /DNA_END=988 /DNA_ORIENTATION=+
MLRSCGHELVEVGKQGGIATVRLRGGRKDEGDVFEWGTRVCEHRINPFMVQALNEALDAALCDPECVAVVVYGEGRFFCNGMDLNWIGKNQDLADKLQEDTEKLLARILCFEVPTIAAINGHFCAAGGMLGLAFDYRVMNSQNGLFFVPAVDLGLVYSPGMTCLMKAKTPTGMHNEMIVMGKRYSAKDLLEKAVINQTVPYSDVFATSLQYARQLTSGGRFRGNKYRDTMKRIKINTYSDTYSALCNSSQGMGFKGGEWDAHGKSKL